MKRLHVHLLAYNTLELVSAALDRFDKQAPDYPIATKLLVDQQWPLVAHPLEHSRQLQELARFHGWHYVKPFRNRGVGGSWDWVTRELDLGDGDVLWGADPDEQPQSDKYLDAAMRVFNAAPECYTVQMNQKLGEYLTYPRDEVTLGGEPVLKFHQPIAWSCGGFDAGWLKRLGGFLQAHPLYGHVESQMCAAAQRFGGRFYILKNHYNVHIEMQEPKYKQWKIDCATFKTHSTFDEWLKASK
jgi:hypothetical protein